MEGDPQKLEYSELLLQKAILDQLRRRLLTTGGFTDATTNAAINITFPHHAIHDGFAFITDTVDETLADNDEIILAFKTMAGIKRAHMILEFNTLVGGDLRLWEGPTWTAETGTLVPILNRKRLAVMASSGFLQDQSQPTFVATDQMILNPNGFSTVPATSLHHLFAWGAQARFSGGIVRDANEWPLKPDTQYAAVFTADGGSNKAQVILNWYENTDKA